MADLVPSALGLLVQKIQDELSHNAWRFFLCLLLTTCIVTRTFTQFRLSLRRADPKTGTNSIPQIPHWLPYLGNTPLFSVRPQSWLLELSRRCQSSVFGMTLYGRDYIVITSPALQASLTDPSVSVSTKLFEDQRRVRFFDHRYISSAASDRISTAFNSYISDSSRTSKLTRLLETHAYNFISPSKSWVDQSQWERGADIKVLETSPHLLVSASLVTLTRDFSAHMLFSALLGTSFIEANPNFPADFFSFSSKYGTFMTGLPYWIAPGLGPPALARERCLTVLESLVTAISSEVGGRSMSGLGVGMLYDTDDVHPAIWGIIKAAQQKPSNERQTTRALASEVLEVIWNVAFCPVNTVIWTLIHLFGQDGQNQSILAEVRTEIKNMLQILQPQSSGMPFEDPPRLAFGTTEEQNELGKMCPKLYGSVLEVLRLRTEPEEYILVEEDVVLSADAPPDPGSTKKPALISNVVEKYQLKKGDNIYAAYGATNNDTYYWDRPRRFAPNRYGLMDGNQGVGMKQPKMRSTHQFDCVPETAFIVMGLLSLYDFEIQGQPSSKVVAGIRIPNSNLKGKVSRRKLDTALSMPNSRLRKKHKE